MIPTGGQSINTVTDVSTEPSKTYKLDLVKGRIDGYIDGLDAVKQAVFKILQTERYQFLIYSFDYGSELNGLIGQKQSFVRSELSRRIEEALYQDDRIQAIQDIRFTFNGDTVTVKFTVVSDAGTFDEEVMSIV